VAPALLRSLAIGLLATTIIAASAHADDYTVAQKGKQFSVKTLSAKVGDTVVFVNDDEFAHNIYSETPGFEFDFHKQMPGEKDTLVLDKAGEFEIRCAIHPRMRMTITVQGR
jgi:plastocyanin